MPLIHPRVFKKIFENAVLTIPETHRLILNDWQHSIESGQIFLQKETSLHSHFIQKILVDVLGYQSFSSQSVYTLMSECPIGKGVVDVALGFFSQDNQSIIAPFELKGAENRNLDAIMAGRHKSPVQQAWEYGMDAIGAKWVLVSNYLEIRLYAIGYGRLAYESFDLARLNEPLEYTRFILLLSKKNLLGKVTEQLLLDSAQIEREITAQLYREYKQLRTALIDGLKSKNQSLNELDAISAAQKILDRVLFVAFAEDTGLLPSNSLKHAYEFNNPYNFQPIWDNFKGLFRAIDKGNIALKIPPYNGGLFKTDAHLDSLNVDDDLCRLFSELGRYDFATEVSVTVLGHIFEQSISSLEELRAQAQGVEVEKIGKRKREGIVYTPDNITNFIVEETVGSYLIKQFNELLKNQGESYKEISENQYEWTNQKSELSFWRAYQAILKSLKIVDIACGSGAFLVAAFDFLLAEYKRVQSKIDLLTNSYDIPNKNKDISKGDLCHAMMSQAVDLEAEILNNNLYGVDINSESIEITMLSLWLKTAKRGKALIPLNNFKVGDSLIEDSSVSHRAFNWQSAFPQVFAQGGFDIVLGNPPYVRQELISHLKPYLQRNYTIYHGVADLFTYFYERGLNLLKPQGKLGFISSNTFFKTSSGENLRNYLIKQTSIERIVDFGELQVFEGVAISVAVLVMENSLPSMNQTVRFLKLNQLPEETLSKYFQANYAIMPQSYLQTDCWRLDDDSIVRLCQKIVANKLTLKEIYGLPLYGIKTGFNEAFVIDKTTRDRLIAEDSHSIEIIKPFLEGKDVKEWHVESRNLYLIFTRQSIDIEQYPAIKKHLEQYRERLEPKPKDYGNSWKGRAKGYYQWFEIQATIAYYEKFEKPKIVYPDIFKKGRFFMDINGYFFSNTVYFIPCNDWFLLGILASNVMWLLLKGKTVPLGDSIRLFSQYVETLPIPSASDAEKLEIGELAGKCQKIAELRYQKQESVRRRIPDLCPPERPTVLNTKLKNWDSLTFKDFRTEIKKCFKVEIPLAERNEWENWLTAERVAITELTQQLQEHEKALNQKVYALFELTEEEIKLVETNN